MLSIFAKFPLSTVSRRLASGSAAPAVRLNAISLEPRAATLEPARQYNRCVGLLEARTSWILTAVCASTLRFEIHEQYRLEVTSNQRDTLFGRNRP